MSDAKVALVLVAACSNSTPPVTTPIPTDTDTSEPRLLPEDTSAYLPPLDTAVPPPPNLTPSHWVYITHSGQWQLGAANPPFGSLTGSLEIVEYVDELDTAVPLYECNVRYVLTGEEVSQHSCSSCDFVFSVEHYVSAGDPTACNDPDTPLSGDVWLLGLDQGANKIVYNYHNTGVWLPWFDAVRTGSVVDFTWEAQLGIEVEETDP